MERKYYIVNKITRFILPFILPDKTLLCNEFGFVNAFTKTLLKKTAIVLVFEYDLKNHLVLHEVLEALNHFKTCYYNMAYERFEFHIPKETYHTVMAILDNDIYGLPSSEKIKIVNFWKDFSLSYMSELLKDLIEIDILKATDIRVEIFTIKGID